MILAGVFTVFSIGIPVVLASCPMMRSAKRGACCPIQNDTHKTILKKYQDYSCCKTVIAAERNRTEFLQTDNNGATIKLHHSGLAILPAILSIGFTHRTTLLLTDVHSPPLIEDIPIFNSSLLI
jgi:hypothetical protein